MKKFIGKQKNISRTLDSNPGTSRQAPISGILQAYKRNAGLNCSFPVLQRMRKVDNEEPHFKAGKEIYEFDVTEESPPKSGKVLDGYRYIFIESEGTKLYYERVEEREVEGPDKEDLEILERLQRLAVKVSDESHTLPEEMGTDENDDFVKEDTVEDERNLHRTWGLSLVRKEALQSGEYLFDLLKESLQEQSSADSATTRSDARTKFEAELKLLEPKIAELVAYGMSGSDIINLAFNAAMISGRKRKGEDLAIKPALVYFQGAYGAGRGDASMINWARWGVKAGPREIVHYALPSPTTILEPQYQYILEGKPEGKELDKIEVLVFRKLNLLEKGETPVGAILLEAIQGSAGVRFYRQEFIIRLREWADERGIPIIADEILTGGGRTGNPFAYKYYEGFEPDIVAFGKGLQIAGMASLNRDIQKESQQIGKYDIGIVTNEASAPLLLKGAAVMKYVRENNLMERASLIGQRLLFGIREIQRRKMGYPEASGLGYFIGAIIPDVSGWKHIKEDAPDWFKGQLPNRRRLIAPLDFEVGDVEAFLKALDAADWKQIKPPGKKYQRLSIQQSVIRYELESDEFFRGVADTLPVTPELETARKKGRVAGSNSIDDTGIEHKIPFPLD